MRILLTGTTGYIGRRLLPKLLQQGHHVICCTRDRKRISPPEPMEGSLEIIEVDFLNQNTLNAIPTDIDAAYYLIHSMSASMVDFDKLEFQSAVNFRKRLNETNVTQVIYLGGISNSPELSKHLGSRKAVEEVLGGGRYHFTSLRAGIIIGSGSASFEIMRDLVEKLPVMVAPRWLKTKSQPIAVRNVLQFLAGVLLNEGSYDQSFDIGGPEVLTYKDMLLQFGKVRGLKRVIIVVPLMTPKLSSYWLYFLTSTSYKLAVSLVDSMKVEVVCRKNVLAQKLGISLITYDEAIRMAFDKIEQQEVLSSWTDALSSDTLQKGIGQHVAIPTHGCFIDQRKVPVKNEDDTLRNIWSIGGKNGWYFANILWEIRGLMDKAVGGVGLRRGRRSQSRINPGDSLDFWRVLLADQKERRLLLFAEMKLPGEAWLEFHILNQTLVQTATFRPLGLWGRLYWYGLLPIHNWIFQGMAEKIASTRNPPTKESKIAA